MNTMTRKNDFASLYGPRTDHRADPYATRLGVLLCRKCDKPVRTADGGKHPVHASV